MTLLIRKNIIAISLILLSFVSTVVAFPHLSDPIITHWGISGQADGYSSKTTGLFLLPTIMLGLLFLFNFLPQIDPYKKNFKEFEKYFFGFISVVFAFLFYLHLLVIVWNSIGGFNMIAFLIPAFSLLFYYIGFLMDKTKRNWFVGIRTPWTMENDEVWSKTHKLGSKLYKISALIGLIGLFVNQVAFFFIIGPIIIVSLFLFFYSYFLYHTKIGK